MTEPVHRFDIEPTFAPAPWIDNVPDAPLSRDDALLEHLVMLAREVARKDCYSFDYTMGKAEALLMVLGGPKTLAEAVATNWRSIGDRAKEKP